MGLPARALQFILIAIIIGRPTYTHFVNSDMYQWCLYNCIHKQSKSLTWEKACPATVCVSCATVAASYNRAFSHLLQNITFTSQSAVYLIGFLPNILHTVVAARQLWKTQLMPLRQWTKARKGCTKVCTASVIEGSYSSAPQGPLPWQQTPGGFMSESLQ